MWGRGGEGREEIHTDRCVEMVGTWRKSRVWSEETDAGRCGEGECTWDRGWRRDRLGVGKWEMGERVERERE